MWKKLVTRARKNARPVASCRRNTRFQPGLEALEQRRVMHSLPFIDDMTELANQFPTKSTPTMLWLNFDGQTSKGVSAFQSAQRENDIQEILFRTSEVFAPFNVQVARHFGDGTFDGSSAKNTTIFIGDIAGQSSGAFTPWEYSDFPSSGRGDMQHVLNSDPFDLAYVDPWLGTGNRSNLWITQAIAHEAGHTFGLAHVLSSPGEDVMSYDATNRAFLNTTYNVTDLNFDPSLGRSVPNEGVQPVWYTTTHVLGFDFPVYNDIVTQNSFATLRRALGARSTSGDIANVADRGAVTPGWVDAAARTMNAVSSYNSAINRMGDYDVFTFTPDRSTTFRAEVRGINGSFLSPSVFVYDTVTDRMVDIKADGNGDGRAEAAFQAVAGRSYRIIVGAENSRTSGEYQLSMDVGAARGDIATFDIGFLAGSQNGIADQVQLDTSSGHVRLLVNGNVIYSDRADHMREARLLGTTDSETFVLGSNLPIKVFVNGGSGTDTLRAPTATNTWQLTGSNSGTLNGNVTYLAVENVTGGGGADTFKVGPNGYQAGTIDGGSGTDTLDYSAQTSGVTVDLARRQGTGATRITAIENVTGSKYSDTILGDGLANVLRGGAGNDTVKGGAGKDQLFGDAGVDWLYGQSGSDTLEGGFDRSFDYLFGDDPNAVAEADVIYNHLYWNGYTWLYEDDLGHLVSGDTLVPIQHWETYRV